MFDVYLRVSIAVNSVLWKSARSARLSSLCTCVARLVVHLLQQWVCVEVIANTLVHDQVLTSAQTL